MKTNIIPSTPVPSPSTSFRLLLQDELARRCARNARYSLRSFARDLALHHSTLSQLVRGRRALSSRMVERLGRRLRLEPAAIERYQAALPREQAPAPAALPEVQQLTHDAVSVITEWHHYGILELCRLDSFRADSRWIARVLGIPVDAVNVAVSRLARLGLLRMDGARWVDGSGDTTTSLRGFPEAAFRRLAEQTSRLGLDAARETPPSLHAHDTTTLAVRRSRVPEAIARITRFRRELAEWLVADAGHDDVYRLEIHLFPITTLTHPSEA